MNAKTILLVILAAVVGNQLAKVVPKTVAKTAPPKKIDGRYQFVRNYGLPPISSQVQPPTQPTDAQRRANR